MLDNRTEPNTTKLDLSNTEIAFAHLDNYQLQQAYWLFRIIGQPLVVQLGPSMTQIALKFRLPIQTLIRKTIFAHFCGGENIEACLPRMTELERYRIGTILDFAREGGGQETDFDAVRDEIIRTIDSVAMHPAVPFAVFKPSGVATLELLTKKARGEALSADQQKAWDRVVQRFLSICRHAYTKKVCIMIDAEESWIQQPVDDLAQDLMRQFNRESAIVFNTVQLYRHDRLEYLNKAEADARVHHYWLGVKLVRGAYLEKENRLAAAQGRRSPLNPTKAATDQMYNEALRFCLEHLQRVALVAGTHNEESVLLLSELMARSQISPDDRRINFAQLLGMSDHISFNLAASGYNVAKYVPYGPLAELLPYLTRRAQENSSVAGQSSRELRLLLQEMQRRGLSR